MSDALFLAISLDRSGPRALQHQLYDALRALIVSGAARPGARLPSSRAFAAELGVSRATVVAAAEQLIAEGYAESRVGSGVFACDVAGLERPVSPPAISTPPPRPSAQGPRAFAYGRPDMRLFPYQDWARAVARAARSAPQAMVETEGFGDPLLRAQISAHLAQWRGVTAPPERIIVTAGAGEALALCMRALTRPGDTVGLEDPGYRPLRIMAQAAGLRPVWLDVDGQGAIPAAAAPALTVLTPSHQFPLGGAMTAARRAAFLAQSGGWIAEDDFDSEYRFAGRPIPAFASLDRSGRVVYVGTFSKIFTAGLRVGFLVCPPGEVEAFAAALRLWGGWASAAAQRPLALFMESGGFHRHVRRMRRVYGARRRAFLAGLRAILPPGAWIEDHQAGMQVALRLPEGADDAAISAAAARAGLDCPALSAYCARGNGPRGLLLGFCALSESEAASALPRLAEVLTEG